MRLVRSFNQYSWAARNVMWWVRLHNSTPKSSDVTPAVWATVLTTVLMTLLAGPVGFGVCMTLLVMYGFIHGMVWLDRYVRGALPNRPSPAPVRRTRPYKFNKNHCQMFPVPRRSR